MIKLKSKHVGGAFSKNNKCKLSITTSFVQILFWTAIARCYFREYINKKVGCQEDLCVEVK